MKVAISASEQNDVGVRKIADFRNCACFAVVDAESGSYRITDISGQRNRRKRFEVLEALKEDGVELVISSSFSRKDEKDLSDLKIETRVVEGGPVQDIVSSLSSEMKVRTRGCGLKHGW
ncbi:MAG: hypothetical protein KJ626_11025 [Verrucomicrobia bacterium]|nr:hypothetical protein [Verrucomicrobiota bacterium]